MHPNPLHVGHVVRGSLLVSLVLGIANFEAFAQSVTASPAASDGQNRVPFLSRPEPGTVRGSKIIGIPVIGMDHVRVGEIEDVLVDGSGRIQFVVIGVGGFLGIGEKAVAVPFDQIAWSLGDVPLTGGATSVTTPRNAPSAQEAGKVGPETMPGGQTTRDVLGAAQDQHSGRVTDATGPIEPQKPTDTPATALAGDTLVRAEVRLTKAQLNEAPAFRFER